MTRSVDVREELTEALRLDLVGPRPHSPYADEVLSDRPSTWYLTGFLVPFEASEETRRGDDSDDVLDSAPHAGHDDDADDGDRASARRTWFASAIGLSVLLPAEVKSLEVRVRWGDYVREKPPKEDKTPRDLWRRKPRQASLNVPVTETVSRHSVPESTTVEGCRGLQIVVTSRSLAPDGGVHRPLGGNEGGQRSLSVFLINHRMPEEKKVADQSFAFQAGFELTVPLGGAFLPRTDPRGRLGHDDEDERIADLHYRDVAEYATGHGVSARSFVDRGRCTRVATTWTPSSEVPRVEAHTAQDVEVGMEALAETGDPGAVLQPLVDAYSAWIREQSAGLEALAERRREMAEELLRRAAVARDRIREGIATLESEPLAHKAFQVANRAMARQARQRLAHLYQDGDVPKWRLFQLAFLLMNVRGVADPQHNDRKVVDLIFFPTGGGKTEAYLGLAAFTMVLRRLQNPGVRSAGLSVLMRYTLRLLTLDQLGRAAALACALELERRDDPSLGDWPFEIGLWVGSAATPNRIGFKGDKNPEATARKLVRDYQSDSKAKPLPIPLAECPWCRHRFGPKSFQLVGQDGKVDQDHPVNLHLRCLNKSCDFTPKKQGHLPILAVDDAIYRRLPAFLIATVDKFAALPWTGPTGALFGKVDRYDALGFYGPCDAAKIGRPIPGGPLLPPDLVIQDELHLISGPLGTMAGLYETAIDYLATRDIDAQEVGPKIVASTATVRQAQAQIQALFARNQVDVFPPPGPDRHDSFFARTVTLSPSGDQGGKTLSDDPGRLYLGVAAPGRSLRVVLLRTYMALLSAAARLYQRHKTRDPNPVDPYMTLLGYFSSLKELGGARRIVEDEVWTRLLNYSQRLRWQEPKGRGLYADRRIRRDVSELTSRESTEKVAKTKDRLAEVHAPKSGAIDVALATNMISVGLDILRLGLMVVLGQPRSTAEYIQSTSRVGRDPERPGLVVTLHNIHRPRDRSHYEGFEFYHETFYRAVEATSVTPFSARAVDRGLAAVTVALARHGWPPLTEPLGAGAIGRHLGKLDFVGRALADRLQAHRRPADAAERAEAQLQADQLRQRAGDLLDAWESFSHGMDEGGLQYAPREVKGAVPLLYPPLAPAPATDYKFRAGRSLRDVEPPVNLWLSFGDDDIEEDEP